jgi:hypothetical protein
MNPGILVTIMLIGAAVAGVVASGKHRNTVGWGFFGALFPLIAVIAICCLPAKPDPYALINPPRAGG